MDPSFRRLRLLLALSRTGSITAAARDCHVSQPTASMQLRELSEALGLPLHEAAGRRVRLTAAGHEVAAAAQRMVDEWEALEQRIAAMKGLEQGRLRVCMASTAKYFLPRMLGPFCQAHPGIDITLEVLNRDRVVQRLREQLDDLYLLSQPPRDIAHQAETLMDNPLVLIAPLDHPLAAVPRLRWQRLRGEPFILREHGSGTRLAVDAHLAALGLQPRVRLELGDNEAIKQAVAAGMGLGVVSRHALAADPAREGLALPSVQRFPVPSSWSVLWPAGRRLSPAAQAFVAHLHAASAGWEAHS
ncbi:LysR family transcriptional regulator [Ideonella sp. 4Y16]|uniref:LysR family transcriptional regulator n=1 Tax=Ideonella alba TaxID=2824118 RepID=A0A940YAW5_9BURK|nr:LysR family transcriptional regulator [Ideonella alba]MBQ0931806.1 LysR family transcriptional regulator [Ideonella alba]MBQ0941751.1 LysR family transcriptional regulator [Ideonella alba]